MNKSEITVIIAYLPCALKMSIAFLENWINKKFHTRKGLFSVNVFVFS